MAAKMFVAKFADRQFPGDGLVVDAVEWSRLIFIVSEALSALATTLTGSAL